MRTAREYRALTAAVVALGSAACHPPAGSRAEEARRAIAGVIGKRVEAIRNKDIESFMAVIPPDLVLVDEAGTRITREQLRANVLRDWGIIRATRSIEERVDSLEARDDSTTVFTTQHWDRLMVERDGSTIDTVVTEERHRETWRRTTTGWHPYSVVELGGTVTVNGRLFTP